MYEVATVEVGIHAADHLRLFPDQGVHAEHGLPVKLHEDRLARGVYEAERMDPEPLHHPVGTRDAPVGHVPHRVVLSFGVQ